MQPENIPQELRSWPQWVCHDADKRPTNAHTGQPASVTDPTTWANFDEACRAQAAGKGVGIGFVLTERDPFTCIDLDGCIGPGDVLSPPAQEIGQGFDSWTERSRSGRGLHIWIKGKVPGGGRRIPGVEAYSEGRFIAMTGDVFAAGPIADRSDILPGFIALRFPQPKAAGFARSLSRPVTRPDNEVLAACRAASNGASFIELEAGQHKGLGIGATGFDHSAADQAMTNILWFHSRNAEQVIRLWQASALGQRSKAHRPDYIERTLDKAADQEFELVAHNLTPPIVAPNPNRFKLLSGDELDRMGPVDWRIKRIIPKKGLFAIGGPSRSAKSFLAMLMGGTIVTGTDFFGHKVETCAVTYAGLEGATGIPGRFKALRQHMQDDLRDFRVILQPVSLGSEQDIQDLAAVCPQGSVLIIDTLARATPGMDENAPKDMGKIIAAATQLYERINGVVILIHHTGKDESKGFRGHSDFIGALDGAIIVSRDGDNRKFKLDKVKDGEDGAYFGFKLETVILGTDEDGEDITSCVVVPADLPTGKSASGPKLSEGEKFLQKCFWEAFNEARKHDYGCGPNGVPLSLWRRVFCKNSTLQPESKERTFRRDLGKLRDKGLFLVENDVASALMPQVPIEGVVS
ncbi:AAA family ATPase [Paracoccus lutimaris]|uniref:AAA domain-containing protein n=1 Tax=Paracoccus lutimaris TaxID=1490030 RepID=A0A368YM33_9RHOB|nr:AAA family ATPase [Paracoccus lutimaris]RCW79977.1 AAA domain-containing protein [Paracoccus lutimaris]